MRYCGVVVVSGVMHSPFYTLFGLHKPHTVVSGFVKPGYEPAREALQALLDQGMEENVQVRHNTARFARCRRCCVVSAPRLTQLLCPLYFSLPQACAYVNDELVLDLVGVLDVNHELSRSYCASSLQNVFSSSKAVASIVVAMLVDRGHLQYHMKVADVWPGERAL